MTRSVLPAEVDTVLPAEVDTVVVGAGTGGAAFAGTLTAHGTGSLLLLDAGPDYGSYAGGHWPADKIGRASCRERV